LFQRFVETKKGNGTLIKKEYSSKGTLMLKKKKWNPHIKKENSSKGTLMLKKKKWNPHIKKENSSKRNTHQKRIGRCNPLTTKKWNTHQKRKMEHSNTKTILGSRSSISSAVRLLHPTSASSWK